MRRRDWGFFGAFSAIAAGLFAPLIFRPWMIPGNYGDLYSYHYPLRHLVAATLEAGHLPLWNPYIFAGTPLAANSQAVLFYPFSALHYFLPLSWAFSLDTFFHVLMAGLGAQLFLRSRGLDAPGASLLALAYGLSPFLIYRIAQGIPTHLNALAWVPWVWLAAGARTPAWLGIAWALQVLSGHPQFSLLNGVGLALFTLVTRPKRLLFLAAAAAIGVCLAGAQALPTLEFLRHSVRSIWDPNLAVGYSLAPSYLLTYIFPNAFGNPHRPDFLLFPSEFFEMLTGYLGIAPLALTAIGLALGPLRLLRLLTSSPSPRRRFLNAVAPWALVAAGVFFAIGTNNPLYLSLQRSLGLDFLRTPSRFAFLVLFGFWLAAAFGWRAVRGRLPGWSVAAALLLTALDLAVWAKPWLYAEDPKIALGSNAAAVAVLREGGGRFATDPDNLTPNKSMQYRLFNATGYEAFYLAPIAVYTSKSERVPAADGSRTYIRNWTTPEMSKLGVSRYVTTREVTDHAPVFRQGDTRIYANPGAKPLVQDAAAWSMLRPEHWVVRLAGSEGPLISQTVYPGWKAWLDGLPVGYRIEDNFFPRFDAPAEDPARQTPPVLHFRYLPGSWFLGAWITALALAASATSGWLLVLKRTGENP